MAIALLAISGAAFAAPTAPPEAAMERRQAETLAAHSSYLEAIPHFQAALAADLTASPLNACRDLNGLAEASAFAGDDRLALHYARQARLLETRNPSQAGIVQARTLRLMGEIADDADQEDKAKTLYQQALGLVPATGTTDAERGYLLGDLGDIASNDGDTATADKDYQDALGVARSAQDTRLTASLQARIGGNLVTENKYADAVRSLESARAMAQSCGDRRTEDQALGNLCLALVYLDRLDEALAAARDGLAVAQTIHDLRGAQVLLQYEGNADFRLARYEEARTAYAQSLAFAARIHSAQNQCSLLGTMGNLALRVSDFGTAIRDFRTAVRVAARIGDEPDQGINLSLLCDAYVEVGQYGPALDAGLQALNLLKRANDDQDAAVCWGNLGRAYRKRGQFLDALACYQTALALDRKVSDRRGEGNILGKIGETDWLLKRYPEADAALTQAAAIARETRDKDTEQWADYNLGNVALDQRRYAQAEAFYASALASAGVTKERRLEAYANSQLMESAREQGEFSLAAWYGKRSINAFQEIRVNLRQVEKRTQASFIASKASIYRSLADLLIRQGRIPEAEQVLGMLKEEEYFDFIGQKRDAADRNDARVDFTPDEKHWLAQYDTLGATVEQAKQEVDRDSLSDVDHPTAAQQDAYNAAKARLDIANQAFESLLKNLAARFSAADQQTAQSAAANVRNNQANSEVLDRLQSNTGLRVVELYTIEADSQYDVILQTPDISRWGAYPISASDLNAKIEQFRAAVQNPDVDPRPLGEDLYRILVGPVAAELAADKPDVVMWSLDGPLGLVPVAALWDGHQYLVQRWQNTLFNAAASGALDAPPSPRAGWKSALGFGVSRSRTIDEDVFPELPGVPLELSAVIRDPRHASSAGGVLPGRFYLDDEFTASDTIRRLEGGAHPIVHIASHFKLSAAGTKDSYLLVGSGPPLTLETIQAEHGLFAHVDLLTLSACSTAVSTRGTDADRNSMDSLDRLAELDGARAVVAALWDVSDASTALLMQTFYSLLTSDPKTTKAGALRAAQIALLTGKQSPLGASLLASLPRGTRGAALAVAVRRDKQDAARPSYPQQTDKPFAHPFYWAPFVLLGNWQ